MPTKLFGNGGADPNFPIPLALIGAKLDARWTTPEKLILQHTILPYYRVFNKAANYESWMSKALHEDGGVSRAMGMMWVPRFISICPLCVADDLANDRKPYFRRNHQILGNLGCPEHSVQLTTLLLKGETQLDYRELSDYPNIATEEPKACHSVWATLAKDLQDSLATPAPVSFWSQARQFVNERGGRGENGWRATVERYLEDAKSEIPSYLKNGVQWYLRAGRQDGLVQPARCLVILRAYGMSLQDFRKFRPTAPRDRRWPCPNRLCAHHDRDVMQLERIIERKSRNPFVVLSCPHCGRRQVQIGLAKKYRIFRCVAILDFGREWNEKFRSLWMNPEVELEELCGAMKIATQSMLHFHAAYLNGLPLDRNGLPCDVRALPRYLYVREKYFLESWVEAPSKIRS